MKGFPFEVPAEYAQRPLLLVSRGEGGAEYAQRPPLLVSKGVGGRGVDVHMRVLCV